MSDVPRVPPAVAALRGAIGVLLALAVDVLLLALAFGGLANLRRDPRALALLAIWTVSGIALAIFRPVRGQDVAASKPDPLPMLLLLVVPLVTPAAGAFAARHAWATLPYANRVSYAGVAMVAIGLLVRVAAMRQLGRRFSPLVAVQREHALETRGLYAAVRHPGYLGALISCLGGAIAFGSAAALPLPAIMLAAQLARIRAEEALLAEHFGDGWRAYAARTGALLPKFGVRG